MPDGYSEFQIPRFDGGLVLQAQPDVLEPTQAVDLLNVTFSERGAVRSRDGFAQLTSSALTNQPDSLSGYLTSGGTKRLIVGNGNRLDVLTSFPGASAANTTAPSASPHFFARFGGPTTEAVYIANGTDQIRKLDGTTFSAPAGLSGQTGKFVAFWQNRLVVAREGGTTAGNNPSSVNFSAPIDPENFATTVYEDLAPGDGEQIMGMVAWRELLFVFKETRFFVFYGIGSNQDGTANPDYRVVDSGCGLAASKALVAARDGVYFLDHKGVYKTTGQEPQQVSDLIDPFFNGTPSIYFRSNTLNRSQIDKCAMGYWNERIYLACPTGSSGTNDRTWEFDPRYGWWSLYDLPVAAMAAFRPSNDEELVFAYSSGENHLGRHSSSFENDDMATDATGGTAITSRWRSGWLDLGSLDVKRVREEKLFGEGVCGVEVTTDFADNGTVGAVTFSTAGTDVWTTDPADLWTDDADDVWGGTRQTVARLFRQARRGSVFSVEFSNSTLSTPWAMHRAVLHVADQKISSTPRVEVGA